MAPDVKYRATQIRKSGDLVNDAVNFWSNAPFTLDQALLPANAFGKIGQQAGLPDEYNVQRAKTIIQLHDGTLTLIQNREAVYLTADRYAGAERKATERTNDIPSPHRPEIDDSPDDYESKYGWARDV